MKALILGISFKGINNNIELDVNFDKNKDKVSIINQDQFDGYLQDNEPETIVIEAIQGNSIKPVFYDIKNLLNRQGLRVTMRVKKSKLNNYKKNIGIIGGIARERGYFMAFINHNPVWLSGDQPYKSFVMQMQAVRKLKGGVKVTFLTRGEHRNIPTTHTINF